MSNRYFFTFGSAEHFPFKGGWVEVLAANAREAVEIFCSYYPLLNGSIINCAFVYDQEEFEKTNQRNIPGWSICHRVLDRKKGEQ